MVLFLAIGYGDKMPGPVPLPSIIAVSILKFVPSLSGDQLYARISANRSQFIRPALPENGPGKLKRPWRSLDLIIKISGYDPARGR
jgi:hypothetical protein